MISLHTSRFPPQFLIILLVALGLLFAGVRVPDSSRPHRPKSSQRVVLENHHKSFPNHLKQGGDLAAVVPNPLIFSDPIPYHAETEVVSPRYLSPLFIPNPGRAPPAALG